MASRLHLAKTPQQLQGKTADVLSEANAPEGRKRSLEHPCWLCPHPRSTGGVNRASGTSKLLGTVIVIKSLFASKRKFISSEQPRGGVENQREMEGALLTSVLARVTCPVPKDRSRKPCTGNVDGGLLSTPSSQSNPRSWKAWVPSPPHRRRSRESTVAGSKGKIITLRSVLHPLQAP